MGFLSGNLLLLRVPKNESVSKQESLPDKSLFSDLGDFQSNTFDFSCSVIEITTKNSAEHFEILNNHGIISLTLSGSGFLKDQDTFRIFERISMNQVLTWFQIKREDGRSYFCKAKLSGNSFEGSQDSALAFSINFASSGTIFVEDEAGQKYDTTSNKYTSFSNKLDSFSLASGVENFTTLPDRKSRSQSVSDQIISINSSDFSNSTGAVNFLNTESDPAIPYFLLRTSDLENKKLQVLDDEDENITIEELRVGKKISDELGTGYRLFIIDHPLLTSESISIKIQIG